ncbi:MAG TPA: hypothetical protein VFR03_01895 [Thermoanaerobaculia bacterium]|nr:hypothetical protein [Thermoanaerobaculia bacterium]
MADQEQEPKETDGPTDGVRTEEDASDLLAEASDVLLAIYELIEPLVDRLRDKRESYKQKFPMVDIPQPMEPSEHARMIEKMRAERTLPGQIPPETDT